MNSYLNILIKLMILLVIVIIIVFVLIFAKVTNFDFNSFFKDEQTPNVKQSTEIQEDKMKKINDSLDQREERIKALKEVGKKLGG